MVAVNNRFIKLTGAVLACAVISACSDFDTSTGAPLNSGAASSGAADFTKFVSIGDSLTAGYADGALYLLGQQNSFPNILAQQMADADEVAVNFVQPLLKHDLQAGVDGNLGALLVGGTPGFIESRFVLNTETETPERLEGTPTDDVVGTGLNGTEFNNVGVPGAASFHLMTPGYGNPAGLPAAANPYFVRFATTNGATVIGDASAQAPSFYTLWIGNIDTLSYATSGGTGVDQKGNTDASTYGSDDITDPAVFAGTYTALVGEMTAANAAVQGVLINLPDVSNIPFFTTVPYNPVPLDQATADILNDAYAAYNAGVAQVLAANPDEVAQRTISFSAGQNALVILDEGLTDITGVNAALVSMRQATAADLVLLPTSSKIGTLADPNDPNSAWGVGVPLADGDVLVPSEITAIKTANAAFNATIKAAADADDNLAFFDMEAHIQSLFESGFDYGTGSINADFATGGGFSLDGVHPTARGYAVIANCLIDAINDNFTGANVHKVDAGTYPTIFLK